MSDNSKTLNNLYNRGKIKAHHVKAAALFEMMISGRSSLDSTIRIQRVDNFSPNITGPLLSDKRLNHLNSLVYLVAYNFIIRGMNLKQIGKLLGAKSNTTAYRRGLAALRTALNEIATIWRLSPG